MGDAEMAKKSLDSYDFILKKNKGGKQGKQGVLKSLQDKLQACEGEVACNAEFGLLDESGKNS